jgi:probable rRNA maturation factor
VSVSDGRGGAVRDGGLVKWLTSVAPRTARGELAIAFVSDARMRVLNRTYRGQDYATDVLSFAPHSAPRTPDPAPRTSHPAARPLGAGPAFSDTLLGDLVIATGVARRQAREAGHAYQTELRVLALHGLLHLLGYDHEQPGDGGRMKRVETRLRRRGGLKAGLIQRTARRRRRRPSASIER